MSDSKYYRRVQLDRREGLGAAEAHIVPIMEDDYKSVWGDITISNGSQQINLHFQGKDNKREEDALYKLNQLIQLLQDFRSRFVDEVENLREVQKNGD